MAEKTQEQIDRDEPRHSEGRDEQIYQLTTLVAGTFSLQEVLDRLAEAAVKIMPGVKACSIRLLDEEAGDLKMRSSYGLSDEYQSKGPVSKHDTVIEQAFAGEAVVLDDVRVDGRVKYKEAAIKEGLVSQLTVAMKFRRKPIGVLRLYSPKPRQFYEDDIALARVVASQCAVAITNAKLYAEAIEGQRMAEQIRLAGVIQRRMIPEKAPSMPGLDIAATYIPCFDVGGDFYDFIRLSSDRVAVAIADVMGKGIPAAIMMSLFRGAVRAYVDTECDKGAVEKIVNKLNKMACGECKDGEFVALFYAVLDVKEKTITYCNCGHEPAVLIRDGKIVELNKGGFVLGVEAGAEYEIETLKLRDGDSLLFYTDGLIDAANFDGEFWGCERMLETAKQFTSLEAGQMVNNILGYRRRFVGLASQVDDTSVIVIKVGK
ncbi:MAG: SpoIIE family protein phosphatase [Phycisphaerae bacterium]|nr:SpoIIE family protein phosphatase [Phycisphaerae bacterium]MDD5380130.1 SpoIIE family protein phosphatase [Phycisphaerae bacterium]